MHSHVYLPRYLDMLRARATVPRVSDSATGPRLVILPGEDAEASTGAGRPIGGEYFETARKLAYMDTHGIDISVVSLANPWLDFLAPAEAVPLARALNDDLEHICATSGGRLFGFGVLPLHAPAEAATELRRIATLPHLRGAIIGASMTGTTLDDPAFDVLWAAAEESGQFLFVHPHHGVGNEGFHGTGHALFLALGFTFETTTAIARLILAGVLERFPALKLLVSHAGGTIPFLAGRLDSCVATDAHMAGRLPHPPSAYIRRLYFDAIGYHTPALQCVIDLAGADRLMFGTDHPFFTPLDRSGDIDRKAWAVATENAAAIDQLAPDIAAGIFAGNAKRLLAL